MLDNVRFLPYQPRERLSESLSSADVHVVGLAPGLAGYVVPSRLYGILAVGRPVIAAVDAESETAHVVETANCGFRVPPASPDLLAAAIRRCHADRGDLVELGRNGREYVEREGNRTVAMERYRALLAEVLEASSREGAIKILRVIARLNVGGPTLHVAYLTKGLTPLGYETTLVTGRIGSERGLDGLRRVGGRCAAALRRLAAAKPLGARRPRSPRSPGRADPLAATGCAPHAHRQGRRARPHGGAALAGSARPEVVVHTYHGHVLTGYFPPLMSRVFLGVERFLARGTDALVAVSPEVRDDLVELGVAPASKFVVVRLGLDLEQRIAAPENARELLTRGALRRAPTSSSSPGSAG